MSDESTRLTVNEYRLLHDFARITDEEAIDAAYDALPERLQEIWDNMSVSDQSFLFDFFIGD